jgi:hypothetical protein
VKADGLGIETEAAVQKFITLQGPAHSPYQAHSFCCESIMDLFTYIGASPNPLLVLGDSCESKATETPTTTPRANVRTLIDNNHGPCSWLGASRGSISVDKGFYDRLLVPSRDLLNQNQQVAR